LSRFLSQMFRPGTNTGCYRLEARQELEETIYEKTHH
jgi:hypothetical protein